MQINSIQEWHQHGVKYSWTLPTRLKRSSPHLRSQTGRKRISELKRNRWDDGCWTRTQGQSKHTRRLRLIRSSGKQGIMVAHRVRRLLRPLMDPDRTRELYLVVTSDLLGCIFTTSVHVSNREETCSTWFSPVLTCKERKQLVLQLRRASNRPFSLLLQSHDQGYHLTWGWAMLRGETRLSSWFHQLFVGQVGWPFWWEPSKHVSITHMHPVFILEGFATAELIITSQCSVTSHTTEFCWDHFMLRCSSALSAVPDVLSI